MVFSRKLKSQIAIAVICFAMAFVVTLQLRGVQKIQTNVQAGRVEVLQENLRREMEKNESLYKQNFDLSEDLKKFKDQASSSSDASERLSAMLNRAEMLAGLTDLEGEGVVIALSDGNGSGKMNVDNINLLLIHDSDILRVVNELRAAGAEAINVNGERILSTSEVRCVGSTICINGIRYTSPFEIKAIGNSQTLGDAFNMPGSIRFDLALYGCEFSVKKQNKIKIDKYSGSISTKYVKEVNS